MVRSEIRTDRAVLGGRASATSTEGSASAAGPVSTGQTQVVPEDYVVVRNEQDFDEVSPQETTSTALAPEQEGAWDPVPVTLPTYVTKPAAARTVRTIDLDSTGVWTSGRTDDDAALARQADAERATQAGAPGHRAVGS